MYPNGLGEIMGTQKFERVLIGERREIMSIEIKPMEMIPAGGNVFSDLGFKPEEVAKLKSDSQRRISLKALFRITW